MLFNILVVSRGCNCARMRGVLKGIVVHGEMVKQLPEILIHVPSASSSVESTVAGDKPPFRSPHALLPTLPIVDMLCSVSIPLIPGNLLPKGMGALSATSALEL